MSSPQVWRVDSRFGAPLTTVWHHSSAMTSQEAKPSQKGFAMLNIELWVWLVACGIELPVCDLWHVGLEITSGHTGIVTNPNGQAASV